MAKYNIEKFKKELEKNPLLENTIEIENTFLGGLLLSDFEEIAKILKTDFDLWIQGISSRSHAMYFRFAKEVKRVYELLLEKYR